MKRILVDLNIVLDVLLDRAPHADRAAELWAIVETGAVEGLLAAHSVTTLHYLAARSGGKDFANHCVANVLSVFRVAPVDAGVLQEAIGLRWPDFEDAVCAAAASRAGCHAIATRDRQRFKRSVVPPLTPLEVLAAIERSPPE